MQSHHLDIVLDRCLNLLAAFDVARSTKSVIMVGMVGQVLEKIADSNKKKVKIINEFALVTNINIDSQKMIRVTPHLQCQGNDRQHNSMKIF
jgi:hypothetical protein